MPYNRIKLLREQVNRLFSENMPVNQKPGKEREFTDKVNKLNKLIWILESGKQKHYNLSDIWKT